MSKIKKQKGLQKGEIMIYKPKTGTARLEVKLEQESLWLSQKQMSKLFKTERSVITKHINNVLTY